MAVRHSYYVRVGLLLVKILHTVEFYHPSQGGAQEVVRQLSERMAAMGHDVTVATSWLPERRTLEHNGVKIKQFVISGNAVRGYEGDVDSYKNFLIKNNFDVVMNYAAQQWATDLYLEVMPQITARKIFVPCGFSGLYDPMYADYFKAMPKVLNSFEATIYLAKNYRDTEFARDHNIKNMHIIPNGADEREFLGEPNRSVLRKLGSGRSNPIILHVGGFTGRKGQPEAMKIFTESQTGPATLVLVGNVFDKPLYKKCRYEALRYNLRPENRRTQKRIVIRRFNRAETVDLLKLAEVFLFPSNVEASPLVLFEACAAHTAFLSTDVGNAREIVKWTGGGEIMPTKRDEVGDSHADIQGSAQALAYLMKNTKHRHALAEKGYTAWNKKYRWDVIAKQYIKLYEGKA